MPWAALPVFTSAVLTVAQLNIIRDDLMVTPAALATLPGQHFAVNGTNSIAARRTAKDTIDVIGTTTNTGWAANLTPTGGGTSSGPAVNIITGQYAGIFLYSVINSSSTSAMSFFGFIASGASAGLYDESDARALGNANTASIKCTAVNWMIGLVTGASTFTARYRINISGQTAQFDDRQMTVLPF